jgi:UDP-glucose 4-epimerase
MKIVVTGASGHLGRYLVAQLAEAGHELVAVSRAGALPALPFGTSERRGSVRALAVDIRDDAAVAKLARELGPEVALAHLAAWHPPATASTSAAERAALIETNVHGTMRVLEAARSGGGGRGGVACVVYASTFEVYAELEGGATELSESSRLAPRTDYGATKLSGEDHLLSFADEEGTRVSALRLPAVYGPGELTPRALPNFLRAVARGERPTIFGDGEDLRDQIHVRDAARALACAIRGTAHGIFNVADGEKHSIAEIARVALEVAAMPGAPERKPRQKPRCDYHMDTRKAQSELAFSATTPLRQGMAEEYAWLRAQG